MEDDRRDLLVKVAWMHYDDGMDQAAIASELGVHRSTVSRLLRDVVSEGIVQIQITEKPSAARAAEQRLVTALNVRGATVALRALSDGDGTQAVARAGARLVEGMLRSGPVSLAVGWGSTLVAMAGRTRPPAHPGALVVDAVGHVLWEGSTAGDVSRLIAQSTRAGLLNVPAPGFAEPGLAAQLLEDPAVLSSLERASTAAAAFVSVGVAEDYSALIGRALPTASSMAELRRRGAVGDILGHFFDTAGAIVDNPWFTPVGLTPLQLRDMTAVYCVAAGKAKALPIRAAVAAGYVDHLVVDDELADALLE